MQIQVNLKSHDVTQKKPKQPKTREKSFKDTKMTECYLTILKIIGNRHK